MNSGSHDIIPTSRLFKAGKRNTSIAYNEHLFFKFFRRLDDGKNPEIELHKKLSQASHDIVPKHIGSLSYCSADNISYDFGICSEYFPHSRTLWHSALDALSQHLEEVLASNTARSPVLSSILDSDGSQPAPKIQLALPGILFEKKARVIGELTAQMHLALVSDKDEHFRIEPFTTHYQRSLYQSFRGLTHRVFSRVEEMLESVPPAYLAELQTLLQHKNELLSIFMNALRTKIPAIRTRIHGDYRLGQIMLMDEQYRICDFEGMSLLPLGERRLKRSPLRDIASMVHSLYWAAHYSLINGVQIQSKDKDWLLPQARNWAFTMGDIFVRTYMKTLQDTSFGKTSLTDTQSLLHVFLLERGLIDLEKALDVDMKLLSIAPRCLMHYLEQSPVFASPLAATDSMPI
jgi:maltose alpha-D-glucosyltransferase/alpha-amylase